MGSVVSSRVRVHILVNFCHENVSLTWLTVVVYERCIGIVMILDFGYILKLDKIIPVEPGPVVMPLMILVYHCPRDILAVLLFTCLIH